MPAGEPRDYYLRFADNAIYNTAAPAPKEEPTSLLEKYSDFTLGGLVAILEAECSSRDDLAERSIAMGEKLKALTERNCELKKQLDNLRAEQNAIPHIEQMEGFDKGAPIYTNWLRAQARIKAQSDKNTWLEAEVTRLRNSLTEYSYNQSFADKRANELERANAQYQSYNDALGERVREYETKLQYPHTPLENYGVNTQTSPAK